MAATFQTISSTRDEYIATVESLKASGPDDSKSSEKRSKVEQSHLTLVKSLEDRIEGIDNELNVSDAPSPSTSSAWWGQAVSSNHFRGYSMVC